MQTKKLNRILKKSNNNEQHTLDKVKNFKGLTHDEIFQDPSDIKENYYMDAKYSNSQIDPKEKRKYFNKENSVDNKKTNRIFAKSHGFQVTNINGMRRKVAAMNYLKTSVNNQSKNETNYFSKSYSKAFCATKHSTEPNPYNITPKNNSFYKYTTTSRTRDTLLDPINTDWSVNELKDTKSSYAKSYSTNFSRPSTQVESTLYYNEIVPNDEEISTLKKELYKNNNIVKTDYHKQLEQNLKTKTQLRALACELRKVKELVDRNKERMREDGEGRPKMDILLVDDFIYPIKEDKTVNNLGLPNTITLKCDIRELKQKKEIVEEEIAQARKCLKEFHIGVENKVILVQEEKYEKMMYKTERQHAKNLINDRILAENKKRLVEFTPRYEVITKDLQTLKEEMNTIVKKNQKKLKPHIKKPASLNNSVFDYTENCHNLNEKRKELIDKQRKTELQRMKNTRLKKQYFSKLEKESYENTGTENFDKLKDMNKIIVKAEKEQEDYNQSAKNMEFMFRNLAYNLQVEFISKEEFLNKVSKSAESVGGILNEKILDDIFHQYFLDRLSLPNILDVVNVIVKLKSMFITGDRYAVSNNEFIKKLNQLIPDIVQFRNEEELIKARQDLKEELQDECSEEYQIINSKIKDLIGLHNSMNIETHLVSDKLLMDVLKNTFDQKLCSCIIYDVFVASNKDCERLSLNHFKNLLKLAPVTLLQNEPKFDKKNLLEVYTHDRSDRTLNIDLKPENYLDQIDEDAHGKYRSEFSDHQSRSPKANSSRHSITKSNRGNSTSKKSFGSPGSTKEYKNIKGYQILTEQEESYLMKENTELEQFYDEDAVLKNPVQPKIITPVKRSKPTEPNSVRSSHGSLNTKRNLYKAVYTFVNLTQNSLEMKAKRRLYKAVYYSFVVKNLKLPDVYAKKEFYKAIYTWIKRVQNKPEQPQNSVFRQQRINSRKGSDHHHKQNPEFGFKNESDETGKFGSEPNQTGRFLISEHSKNDDNIMETKNMQSANDLLQNDQQLELSFARHESEIVVKQQFVTNPKNTNDQADKKSSNPMIQKSDSKKDHKIKPIVATSFELDKSSKKKRSIILDGSNVYSDYEIVSKRDSLRNSLVGKISGQNSNRNNEIKGFSRDNSLDNKENNTTNKKNTGSVKNSQEKIIGLEDQSPNKTQDFNKKLSFQEQSPKNKNSKNPSPKNSNSKDINIDSKRVQIDSSDKNSSTEVKDKWNLQLDKKESINSNDQFHKKGSNQNEIDILADDIFQPSNNEKNNKALKDSLFADSRELDFYGSKDSKSKLPTTKKKTLTQNSNDSNLGW